MLSHDDIHIPACDEFLANDRVSNVVWIVQEEAIRKQKEQSLRQDFQHAEEAKARKEAMRKEAGLVEGAGEPAATGNSKLADNPTR